MTKRRLTITERRAADKARARRHIDRQKELGRRIYTRWTTEEEREVLDTTLKAYREATGT